MLETPTYIEWAVPATDTAKISFLCFDDEDEFDDWECLLNDCRRNLKELSENAKSRGGGRNLEHSQVCYFEFLGFPDIELRRDLKDATALDTGGRKLQPGVSSARQLNTVFTNSGAPSAVSTSSWAFTSPVRKLAAGV